MKLFKQVMAGLIILTLTISLVGCVAKSEYETLQEKYTDLQANYEVLQEENSNLQQKNSNLQEENTNLQTDLDDLQADYNILLEGKVNLETELAEMLAETESLQEQLEDLQNTLNLYRYTYGMVYSKVQPPLSKTLLGDPIILLNNEVAIDPTWEQLKVFLGMDETDRDLYLVGSQMCGYFAEKLHNSAEATGIKCALVALNLGNGNYHTLNAFKTTDSGLIFIDSTGREIQPIQMGWSPPSNPSWDRIAIVEMGKEVSYENLFPERATYTTWPTYVFQRQEVEWESIGTVYDIELYW